MIFLYILNVYTFAKKKIFCRDEVLGGYTVT